MKTAMIINESSKKRSILIDFFCTSNEVGEVLDELGFIRESNMLQRIPYLFRPIKLTEGIAVGIDIPPHRSKRDVDFSKYYITNGDGDIDRIKL